MKAAVYCRLSKEDGESESIKNQKELLSEYAAKHGWEIYKTYCDEDYSGADSERPGFNELIDAAKNREFDIILVKTQSRFTRDMESVERYIHGLFPALGIRFIAVVDNADTEVKGNKKARQINGLVNEWYLEDLSENIRAVLDLKRKNGEYIGAFPVYGYKKDPDNKNKLIVDSEAAEVVREIYRLYLNGFGKSGIANILNGRGVLNPTRYKQTNGLCYVNAAQTGNTGQWNRTSVGRILKDRMYTGDIVQGKRKKPSYKSKKLIQVPEEDWIVVCGTHEPIIDKETFEAVGRLLRERTKSTGMGTVHPLAGKVKCTDCKSAMVKTSNIYKGKRRSYLRCGLYAADKTQCAKHSVRLDLLENSVLYALREYIGKYFDKSVLKTLMDSTVESDKRNVLINESRKLEHEIERRAKAIRALYLDYSSGIIDKEQFKDLNGSFINEKCVYMKRLSEIRKRLSGYHKTVWSIDKLLNCLEFNALPRELVAELIDSVYVGESVSGKQKIQINWLY